MAKSYYFVSDLHIGGDDQLMLCDFETELIDFLKSLESRDKDTELLLVGDVFGLWEVTTVEGPGKLDEIIKHHEPLFAQLKATGEKIKITVIAGNHDHELACYPEYGEKLARYNVSLEYEPAITRELLGKKIHIEHGMQRDPKNRMPEFGNPNAQPLGYFVTSFIVGTAGRLSKRGRYNWLRDIQSVQPVELVPDWVASNYFYREMSPLLRYALVPLLVLFPFSLIYTIGALLEHWGVLPTRFFLDNDFTAILGPIGRVVDLVLLINGIVIGILAMVFIPAWLFFRDAKKTMQRFGVLADDLALEEQTDTYLKAAEEVFEEHPDVLFYVYGHTHEAFLEKMGDRYAVNTGTWLKKLTRVRSRLPLMPPVYWASFCLNYFVIEEEDGQIVVRYERIPHAEPHELKWLQRLSSRRPESKQLRIPARTTVPV